MNHSCPCIFAATRRAWTLLGCSALALGACAEEGEIQPVLSTLDADAPQKVELVSGVGRGTVDMPVRLVNQYGAAVAGTEATVSVSGACADGTPAVLVDATVVFDESGYGRAQVHAPCSTRFDLTVTDSADGAEPGDTEAGYALANIPPVFQMGDGAALPAEARDPQMVAAGTHGIAIGAGKDIWWQGRDVEQPPHRVASLPTSLTGMQGTHIDADGVMDLVAWGGSVAFALRGLDGGGYTWEGGFYVEDGREITGVGIQDLNGDTYPDLAVAVSDGHDGWVELRFGNGAWEWKTTDVLETSFPVGGVTAEDEEHDGWADLTVLDSDGGYLRRWTQSADGWLEGAPPELQDPTQGGYYDAPDGSRLLPMVELNHDGRQDIVVNEAPGAGSQLLIFFIMGTNGVTFFHEPYTAYFTDTADMNQDGASDLLALEDGVLHIIRHDLPTGEFTSQGELGVGLAAPVVAAFVNDDQVHDVAIVKDTAAIYPGELVADEKTGQLLWSAVKWDWTSYQLALSGPHVVSEITGDGLADVVGFTTDSTGTTLVRSWSVTLDKGTPVVSVLGASVGFDAATNLTPYDLVQCGPSYYALAGDGAAAELLRITADTGGLTRVVSRQASGTLLACGPLGKASVIVGNENGAWTSYDTALAEIDSGDVGQAGDMAAADPDGDGINVLKSCSPAPCSIAAADIDGDGKDEIVRGDATGVSIEGWKNTTNLGGAGAVSIGDVDRDGFKDIVAVDESTGQILVFRGVLNGMAPAVAYHTDEEVHGEGAAFDATGDGVPEFLVEGAGGTLSISAPSVPAAN